MFNIMHKGTQSKFSQLRSSVISTGSPRGDIAHQFIRQIFQDTYNASIEPKPDAFVVCERNTVSQCIPLACAGLTFGFARNRLFSEQYLDDAIDVVLDRIGKHVIERSEIVEIGSLASRNAAAAADLIRVLPIIAWFLGMRAILCTITAGLRKLLDYHHIPFVVLTEASSERLSVVERECWGSYYENSPLTGIIPLQECGNLFSSHCGRFVFANLSGVVAESAAPSQAQQDAVA